MAKKFIHVNQHKIRSNLKHGTNEAVITVKEGRSNTYGHSVEIHGPSKILYTCLQDLSPFSKVICAKRSSPLSQFFLTLSWL